MTKANILDRKDFTDDILANIENTIVFVLRNINTRYEIAGSPRRKEIYEIPPDALRESIVNAVLHRDYFEKGARVMVEIFDDRVEISNPGGEQEAFRENGTELPQ